MGLTLANVPTVSWGRYCHPAGQGCPHHLLEGERVMGIGPESAAHRLGALQAKAHIPEVQAIIRREIAGGSIRVAPAPGGGIRIIRTDGGMVEEPEPLPAPCTSTVRPTVSPPCASGELRHDQ
jgi:hypothetical protein